MKFNKDMLLLYAVTESGRQQIQLHPNKFSLHTPTTYLLLKTLPDNLSGSLLLFKGYAR